MSGYNQDQLDRLEPPYLSGMGLKQAPFTSVHEDRFLYQDAERDQCNNMLHHLTQYSNLLLIVTGERGIGKTSLLKHFINTRHEEWSLCEVQANAMMDAHQLLASIAQGFGLQVSNQPANVLQETLYQYLVSLQQNNRVPILLVDDAHELPKDALETLFTLADTETAGDNLLRIILFCEPQIEIMLESPAIQPLRDRITHTIEIPAFNEEHTAEYIKHRLAVSGFIGNSPFLPKDIKKIYKVSQGIPAKINELAHLHLSGEQHASSVPDDMPDEYRQLNFSIKRIAAGIVVIGLVTGVLYFQDDINNLFEDKPADNLTLVSKEVQPFVTKPAEELPAENKTIDIQVPVNEPLAENPVIETPQQEQNSSETEPQTETVVEPVIEKPVEKKPEPPVPMMIRGVLPDPVTGNKNRQDILVNGEGFTKDTRLTVSWSGNKKQLKADQVVYENSGQLRMLVSVGERADTWSVQARDPLHGSSNTYQFKVSAAPVKGLQTVRWINQQNASHFTMQLLGTYNKSSLSSFVKQHQLETDTAYFVTQREGRNWYTLVHGNFESKPAAQQALTRLPADLQKTRPWIRQFAAIQTPSKPSTTRNQAKPGSADMVAPSEPDIDDNVTPIAKLPGLQPLDLTANAAWLWSQDPAHYTLQLLGSQKLEALRDYTRKHNLGKNTTYYRTMRNNHQWFVLLYGSYAQKEQARKAIDNLPDSLKQSSPFPRRFADIHAELTTQ